MKFFFVKMQGCGNDFVLIDARKEGNRPWAEVSARLLDRRFGVGGDQLLVILPSKKADARMDIFERNGQQSEMCGNGIRCAARYLKENGESKNEISFETLAGIKTVEIESFDRICVDMGAPVFEPKEIPVADSTQVWGKAFEVQGQKIQIYPLSMGNPHAVVFVNSMSDLDQASMLGPALETHSFFPQKTNVEFVFVRDKENIAVRMWERAAGETFACGTGACAAGVAAIKENQTTSPVRIHFKGGTVEILWTPGQSVFMTGPATHVFKGEIEL